MVPIKDSLNASPYLYIVVKHVRQFMTAMNPSFGGRFRQDNELCDKLKKHVVDWFMKHSNKISVLKWCPQSPDLHLIGHLLDVAERDIRILNVKPPNLNFAECNNNNSEKCFQNRVEVPPK